jgi:dienelactone hydrolase
MRDDDRLLDLPEPEFGSGIVGVCDICGERQAVVILLKERYRLCVLDFLNKTWIKSDKRPSAPTPLYRSERVWFATEAAPGGRAPAIVLSPTKMVRHPAVLIAPDTYGITTTLLDAAIRFAHEGFEVLIPDVGKTDGVGLTQHVSLRAGRTLRGGVQVSSSKVAGLLALYRDGLRYLLGREMVDATRSAVFGTSYGGALALALAAESTSLTAVALAYPVPTFPADLPGLLTAPLLLVRGDADRLAERAERQVRATAAAGNTTFVSVPGAGHDFLSRDLGAYDVALAEPAWAQIVAFLKARLVPPPPTPPSPPGRPAAGPAATTSTPRAVPSPAATAPPAPKV